MIVCIKILGFFKNTIQITWSPKNKRTFNNAFFLRSERCYQLIEHLIEMQILVKKMIKPPSRDSSIFASVFIYFQFE
jgi:hypothetical protein